MNNSTRTGDAVFLPVCRVAFAGGASNVHPIHELHGPPEPPPPPYKPSKELRIAAAKAIAAILETRRPELRGKAKKWAAKPPKIHRFYGAQVVAMPAGENCVQVAFIFGGVQLRDVFFRY